MSDLYDADFLIWSERQAELLRRMARGERVNELDWDNLIEEVESLGRSEFNAVRSLLGRALEHLLKAAAWPQASSAPAWRHEARVFLQDAADRWTPSMAHRIDLPRLYERARVNVLDLEYQEGPAAELPRLCPATLAQLIEGDIRLLAARFHPPA